jgi:hypothetical protein
VGVARERLQSERDVAGRLEPFVRGFLEAVANQPFQNWRHFVALLTQIAWIAAEDCAHRVGMGGARERAPARKHLVKDRAEAENIRSVIGRKPANLLGRHVPDRTEHHARRRPALDRQRGRLPGRLPGRITGRRQFGDSEIENLDATVAGDEHVLRLEVAVDDALVMRGGQTARELRGVLDCLPYGERPSAKPLAQRLAVEELRHEVADAAVGADVEHREDIWVIERRCRACFLLESPQAIGVDPGRRGEHFEGDVAIEPRIAGTEDLAHTAGADRAHDLIGPESRSCGDAHEKGRTGSPGAPSS